jgi:hypothetical protein
LGYGHYATALSGRILIIAIVISQGVVSGRLLYKKPLFINDYGGMNTEARDASEHLRMHPSLFIMLSVMTDYVC